MDWLDELQKTVGGFELRVAGRRPTQGKTPRDTLLQSIDDSIAFLKDPSFRVASGKRKNKEPDLVYRIDGSLATVALRYSRERLKIRSESNEIVADVSKLAVILEGLREGVVGGNFDDQLNKIKANRIAVANASKGKRD